MSKRINEIFPNKKKIKYVNEISTFETMSNELFMELFEYFDLYTLYLAFYSLNSRFNSIICHCQLHVNLNQINPLYFTSFIGQFIYSNINKGRICSLRSSIPHQISVLINDITMDRFTLLRSLTLSRCSIDLVEQILNRIEKSILEKISILSCKKILNRRFSLTRNLLSISRYPLLRSINFKLCSRGLVNLSDIDISPMNLFHRLEYFSLDKSTDIENLLNLLYRSSHLRSLNIVLNNFTDIFRISNEYEKFSYLLRLKLTSSIIQISTLEYLINNCPNLISLYLDFSTRSSKLIDTQYWKILIKNMFNIKYVYIKMVIQLIETNLSHEQVRLRIKLLEPSLFFTRILINRMNTIRIIINRSK